MKNLLKMFTPFQTIKGSSKTIMLTIWLGSLFAIWGLCAMGTTHLFPTPAQVLKGFTTIWADGLIVHLFSSLALCAQAVLFSVIISLFFTYLSTLPFFKGWADFISKLRFLPLAGITFYITIIISSARTIQVWVLVMFMSTYLITSLIQMIKDIPQEEFDHARTLGCNRWETLWEVVIKGRFDYVFELVRQNLAIVWMMLVSIESILIAAGGLGVLIKNGDKVGDNGRVIAVQIVIILVGIFLDFLIIKTRKLIFRYSNF
jgi:ABC-type nitrate/sulfonate/bicarbonate transport system permease component